MLRGRYRIVERLGAGAMGTVYRVEDALAGGATRALKALWPGAAGDALVATLRSEFGVLARLRHPLLCRVHDFGRLPPEALEGAPDEHGYFLTRELVDGADLAAAAARDRDPGRLSRLLADAARGLDVLHRAGLRHGDFKPGNAILEGDGRVRLIDFGLTAPEASARAAGTVAYMAPEVAAGRPADRRADLYAVGVAIYELVAGRWPFPASASGDVVRWHASGERPRLSALGVATDVLDELALRCLEVDPERRIASAAELAAGLDACADLLGAPPRREEPEPLVVPAVAGGPVTALERHVDRRRRGRGGAAVVEVVGDAGAGVSTALTELSWRAQLAGAEVVRAGAEQGGRPGGAVGVCLEQLAALAGRALPRADDAGGAAAHAAAVAGWLEQASRAFPVVLVLDDLDEADPLSRELVDYLAFALPPEARVLVAVGRRRPSGRREAEVVTLAPLSLGDVDALLTEVAGRRDVRLAARVHEHTGGNLLHVLSTFEALRARRFPPAESFDPLTLPPRLEAALAATVAGLGDAERATCAALAVLGRPASGAVCAAVLGVEEAALARPAGLVEAGPDGALRLARPSMRGLVLRGLAADERARLHRAAASALAERGADEAEIVRHRVRAGDADDADAIGRAIEALWAAGDRPAALALGEEAAAARPDDRALRLRVGELAQLAGDAERAAALLEPLAGEADRIGARARLAWARVLGRGGELDRAEALLEALADTAVAPQAASELAQLHLRRGRFAEALEVVDRALESGEPAAPPLVVARAFARGILGLDDGAEAELEEVAAAPDAGLAAAALHHAARIAYGRGDYRAARERYQRALALAEGAGDLGRIGVLRMNLAAMDFSFGDLAGSRRHYGPAVSFLAAAGARTFEVIARRNLGHLLLELGAVQQARRALTEARAAAREVDLPVHDLGIGALFGLCAWREGDLGRGRDELEAARRGFERLGDARRASETTLDLAELELDAAELDPARLDDAEILLRGAAAIAATTEDTARRGRFLALGAELASRRGDRAAARERLGELDDVLEELARQGARQLEWDLRRIAASAQERLGAGVEAAAQRRAARDLLEAAAADLGVGERVAFWQDPRRRGLRAPSGGSGGHALESTTLAPSGAGHMVERVYRLLEIYRRLSSERDVDRLLEQVMDSAVELTGSERGFLLLAEEGSGQLAIAVERNLPPGPPGGGDLATGPAERRYSRSIAEEVFARGEPVVSRDARLDPRFEEARSVHALRVESVVCVPVHARGRVVGALYLEGLTRRSGLSDDDLRLLMAFGDQVAVLLENARLAGENRRRADELEAARREIEALLADRTELLEQRTAELAGARRDLADVQRRFLGERGAFGLIGRSPAMERVFQLLGKLAATDVPVLVLGESGTGKELVARALHEGSPRREARLVSVNCGALPEPLLESELFGHERGAFTGAESRRRGLFELADGGTLLLDEVGETPPRMQASLLRALQEGVVRRVGGADELRVDVRVVAATNRDLEELVAAGRFREDLYYRLHVVPIHVPPLRERDGDLPLLIEHFLGRIAERTGAAPKRLTRRALRLLGAQRWPGNVRQLEHALTSAAVLADGELLDLDDLTPLLRPREEAAPAPAPPADRSAAERARILEALEASGWNKSEAARRLGMPRRTFYRRLAEHDIR